MTKPAGRHNVTAEVLVYRHRRQRDRGETDHPDHLYHECPTPQLPSNGSSEHEHERRDDRCHHRVDLVLQPQSGERRDDANCQEPRGLAALQDGSGQ